jgi:hypothetical protein
VNIFLGRLERLVTACRLAVGDTDRLGGLRYVSCVPSRLALQSPPKPRNLKQIQIPENVKYSKLFKGHRFGHFLQFSALDFVFVSDFEPRISDLEMPRPRW